MENQPKKKTKLDPDFVAGILNPEINDLLHGCDGELGKSWQYHLVEKKQLLTQLEAYAEFMHDELSHQLQRVVAEKIAALRMEIAQDEKDRAANWDRITDMNIH